MKKFKQFIAFVLALCMLFSLSVAAFAAEPEAHTIYASSPDEEVAVSVETASSGTIPGSKIKWELNEHNWLMISGSGDCAPFASKDDQPWAAVRDQITQVWFDDMENLKISDLAYWFEDCTALTTAEIPGTTPTIGRHAFYNCPKLSTLTIYYGESILESIGEEAFWRENDSGDTLYIGYIIGYPKSSVPFHTYDWTGSNRNNKYFYDLYGVYSDTLTVSATMSAPGVSVTSTGSIIGNCPSCGKYSFQGTYVEIAHSSRGHANYNECNSCHYVQYLGTYTTKSHGSGAYGSGTCPDCGSHTWVLQSQQAATCTSNGYRSYSCACGQTKSETIYASGHSYSYGSWEQYSSSQHRRTGSCRNCGATDYDYASHSMSYGAWSNSSSSQHTTIQERLKDLRLNKGLKLEELAEQTGISKSALGSYEKDDYKEINHGNLILLADFYGVSLDYLFCRTENRAEINTPLRELHLSDEMVALLKSGRINNRLLCELATHKDFIKFLADIEIYVDGIATMQIQNLNALVDTVRHEIIERYRPGEDDPHLKVLQAAHISDDEYFSHMVLDDLNLIIRDIREAHKKDSESAPQTTVADELKENLEAVENFKGSRDEKLVVLYCKQLGINYKNLSDEEFRWLIRILKKSKKMGTPISQRKKR